jgi:hypothetical protein
VSEDFDNVRVSDWISSTELANESLILSFRTDLTYKGVNNALVKGEETNSIIAIIDNSSYGQKEAFFSIGKTVFICIILTLLLHLFSSDIDELLVIPIEGMMQKLMNMAKDPESASKEEIDFDAQYETTIISNAIIKIGALLSIVFGSAGAEIIGSNIIEEGDMNPMIEGKKKCAIFGFCDIRHFTEVTEVLQE